MSYKKFSKDDIFISRVKTYPKYSFFVHSGSVYINNMPHISGSGGGDNLNYLNTEHGHISLRELNIGEARPNGSFIKYELPRDSYNNVFKKDVINLLGKVPSDSVFFPPPPGQAFSRALPLSASIYRTYLHPLQSTSNYINPSNGLLESNPNGIQIHPSASALKNLAHHYSVMNPILKDFNSYLSDPINMIKIPSIFYGSSIRKGSVDLKFFYTGSLVSRCSDERQNGQLIASTPQHIPTGQVVGHVFYNEGIIIFPSSLAYTALLNESIQTTGSSSDRPRWIHFGLGLPNNNTDPLYTAHPSPSASFEINFEGTSYLNNMTMLCHMDRGEYNYSNNPTYQDLSQEKIQYFNSSRFSYGEPPIKIKNVASSSHFKGEDDFRKVTYVTKVGIYDENDQLIMTADLARPYKKEEKDNFTFKIKYDLL